MQKKFVNLLLILISTYIGLVLLSFPLYNKYKKTYNDQKIKLKNETINLLNKLKNDENVRNISHNFHYLYNLKNILPLNTNKSNSVIVYGKEEYWSIYNTDKYGFFHNSNQSYIDPEIILLGDSFARGCCVNKENVPSNILEKKGYKTLNLATGGGNLIEFATYLEYANNYKNKIVMLFFYEGNDYQDNLEEFQNKTLIKYFENPNFSQNLINRQTEIDEKITKKLEELIIKTPQSNFNLIDALKLKYLEIIYIKLNQKFKIKMYKMNKDLSNVRLEKLFIKFKEITLLNNNQLVVVHIPLSTRYNENNNQELDNKKNELSKILKENNIKFLDFTNHVKEKKLYKDIYRFDKEILENINFHPIKKRHFNKQGYQELVKFILNNIE